MSPDEGIWQTTYDPDSASYMQARGAAAERFDPRAPFKKTVVSLVHAFVVGSRRYLVRCVYDVRPGTGDLALSIEKM